MYAVADYNTTIIYGIGQTIEEALEDATMQGVDVTGCKRNIPLNTGELCVLPCTDEVANHVLMYGGDVDGLTFDESHISMEVDE